MPISPSRRSGLRSRFLYLPGRAGFRRGGRREGVDGPGSRSPSPSGLLNRLLLLQIGEAGRAPGHLTAGILPAEGIERVDRVGGASLGCCLRISVLPRGHSQQRRKCHAVSPCHARARCSGLSGPLTPGDKLSFGPDAERKKLIPIKGETTLIYVDLAPDARFAHPTHCVLVSAEGTRVIQGDWWLVLNGKPLFREDKISQVDFPISLTGQ
jgi:hypothetical protein